jgi:hypothetical protein
LSTNVNDDAAFILRRRRAIRAFLTEVWLRAARVKVFARAAPEQSGQASVPEATGGEQEQPRLGLHITVVLLLKFVLLALLWYLLVMPYLVHVDTPAMGERLTHVPPQPNVKM